MAYNEFCHLVSAKIFPGFPSIRTVLCIGGSSMKDQSEKIRR